MLVVAVAAVLLRVIRHVVAMWNDSDDFAMGFLILEAFGVTILGAIALAAWVPIGLLRRDDAYVLELNRKATPEVWPFPSSTAEGQEWRGVDLGIRVVPGWDETDEHSFEV